jgi:hypothetical protein
MIGRIDLFRKVVKKYGIIDNPMILMIEAPYKAKRNMSEKLRE